MTTKLKSIIDELKQLAMIQHNIVDKTSMIASTNYQSVKLLELVDKLTVLDREIDDDRSAMVKQYSCNH